MLECFTTLVSRANDLTIPPIWSLERWFDRFIRLMTSAILGLLSCLAMQVQNTRALTCPHHLEASLS